jgi:hypothetical protein
VGFAVAAFAATVFTTVAFTAVVLTVVAPAAVALTAVDDSYNEVTYQGRAGAPANTFWS